MAARPFAIVAGVGPGTGAAVARKFAASYPVILLARNPANYESLVTEINKSGGHAIGISTDVSSSSSVKSAFQKIEQEFQGAGCAAAVFNASGRFVRKPLLELSEEEFCAGFEVSWYVTLPSRARRLESLLPEGRTEHCARRWGRHADEDDPAVKELSCSLKRLSPYS